MKVFISWSGPQSQDVALALREWLPRVIQRIQPWVSSEDISKGAGWLAEIDNELLTTDRGIVCVTPGNEESAWLNYEAGAMAKKTGQKRVCVALLGVENTDMRGPLKNFQSTGLLDKEDVLKLVTAFNTDLPDADRLPPRLLEHSFDREWEWLQTRLTDAAKSKEAKAEEPTPHREDRELLEDILALVRSMSRDIAATKPPTKPVSGNPLADLPVPEWAVERSPERLALQEARMSNDYKLGERVAHDSFGVGSIVRVEGAGDKKMLHVNFGPEVGVKRLLVRYAPIEYLGGEGSEASLPF